MRIDGSAYVVELSRTAPVAKENGTAAVEGTRSPDRVKSFDRVEISADGHNVEELKRQMAALPDVRLDRVALARQTLQDGGYNVKPALLAQKMIEAHGA